MNTKELEDYEPKINETIQLIDALHQKYKVHGDRVSNNAAVMIHQVSKELRLIVDEKKSAIQLNYNLRGKIQELETAISEARVAQKTFEGKSAIIEVGQDIQRKVNDLASALQIMSVDTNTLENLRKEHAICDANLTQEYTRKDEGLKMIANLETKLQSAKDAAMQASDFEKKYKDLVEKIEKNTSQALTKISTMEYNVQDAREAAIQAAKDQAKHNSDLENAEEKSSQALTKITALKTDLQIAKDAMLQAQRSQLKHEEKSSQAHTKITALETDLQVAKEASVQAEQARAKYEEGYSKSLTKISTLEKDLIKAKDTNIQAQLSRAECSGGLEQAMKDVAQLNNQLSNLQEDLKANAVEKALSIESSRQMSKLQDHIVSANKNVGWYRRQYASEEIASNRYKGEVERLEAELLDERKNATYNKAIYSQHTCRLTDAKAREDDMNANYSRLAKDLTKINSVLGKRMNQPCASCKQTLPALEITRAKITNLSVQVSEKNGKIENLEYRQELAIQEKIALKLQIKGKQEDLDATERNFKSKLIELEDLQKEHIKAANSLKAAHSVELNRLKKEHAASKKAAIDESLKLLKKDHTAQLNTLNREKKVLTDQLRMKTSPITILSPPTEKEDETSTEAAKKRTYDRFGGSPESKLSQKFRQHRKAVEDIMETMVFQGISNVHLAYSEITRCFGLPTSVQKYKMYAESDDLLEDWYCLANLTVLGHSETTPSEDGEGCETCREKNRPWCIKVQQNRDTVSVRMDKVPF